MEYILNDCHIINCNADEIIIKKGYFSGDMVILNDDMKSKKLYLVGEFLQKNHIFSIEEFAKGLEISNDEAQTTIDFLIENDVLKRNVKKMKSKLKVICLTEKKNINEAKLVFDNKNYLDVNFSDLLEFKEGEIDNQNFDFIIVLSDFYRPYLFHRVNKYCIENNKNHLITFFDNNNAYILPIYIKNYTVCYNETELHLEASSNDVLLIKKQKENLKTIELNFEKKYDKQEIFFVYSFAFSKLKSYETFKFEENKIFKIDLTDFYIDSTKVLKLPYCAACNEDETYTHIFL